jgi:hypothetical protein
MVKLICKDRKGKQMSKAKVISKVKADGAEILEGLNSEGDYFFEAWLPEGKIWDNAYGTGSFYGSMDQYSSKAELWADALYTVGPQAIYKA